MTTAKRFDPHPQLRNILFLCALFFSTVALNALQKPLFLLRYAQLCEGASAAELLTVAGRGLHLDLTVAGYVTALPIVLTLIHLWLGGRWLRNILRVYLPVIAAVEAWCFAVNLGLYGYWGFPLDASILQFLATPKEAAASVSIAEWIAYSLCTAAYFAATYFVYINILRILPRTRSADRRIGIGIAMSLVLLLVAGLDFLAIRGGTTTAVANVSKVYFSEKQFLNHAAVNPVFSFLSSAAAGDRLDEYEFFDETERSRIFERLRGDRPMSNPDRTPLLRTERPDIVFVLAESFGRTLVDERVDGVAAAPNYCRLKEESVFFNNLIANSFRTDRGTTALLSAFPAQPKTSVMKMAAKARNLPSIARSLREAGYSTSYLYGGDLNFTNTAAYLYGTGFETLVWQKDMHFDAPTSKWGYADDVTGDLFADHILAQGQKGRPFFTVWQTLSSHEPFEVPIDRFEDRVLNSIAFTDECIGRLVERLRESPLWDNLLIIIVADHGYRYPYDIAPDGVLRHRIPMLWLGGAVAAPQTVETYASQSDLVATLLAQLGIDHSDFLFSRDIFDPEMPAFGYYCFNDGFGVVDADGETIYDHISGRTSSSDDRGEKRLETGKALLQTTFKTIREL